GGFVLVLREMAVDAVVADIEFAADEPLPEGRMRSVENGLPLLVPGKEVGVFLEALGEVLLVELLDEFFVGEIGLGDEGLGRTDVLFFLPVDGDLGFAEFALFAFGGWLDLFSGSGHGVLRLGGIDARRAIAGK